ncbi:MAG: family 16 glycosylhydrolase, partial [Frankia sp.]
MSQHARPRPPRRRRALRVLISLPVVAAAFLVVIVARGGTEPSSAALPSSVAGSFSCVTSATGSCLVSDDLGGPPASVTVAAWTPDTGVTTQIPATATDVQKASFVVWARDKTGAPLRNGRIHGSYLARFRCGPSTGHPCRGGVPTPDPTNTIPPSGSGGVGGAAGGLAGSPTPSPTATATRPSTGPTTGSTAPATTAPATTPATDGATPTAEPTTGTTPPGAGSGAKLVWSDEFNGAQGSAPDPSNWTAINGSAHGTGELECYTPNSANVSLDGQGDLALTARHEASCDGMSYSSGRLESAHKRTFRYGYVEARIKMPTGSGAFPAFWTLGANLPQVGWPRSGEVDIAEITSNLPNSVHTNVHGVDASGKAWQVGWGSPGGTVTTAGNLDGAFHTYGLLWTPDALTFYFDGQAIHTVSRSQVPVWLWDQDNYLILNVAV